MNEINPILTFWLDDVGPEGWFAVDEDVDRAIVRDFQPLWREARGGGLGSWNSTARGVLAFLILTDQFPRNMFRGTGCAFASDAIARSAAKSAIVRGLDGKIEEQARMFFYLPLMHSESLADQDICICKVLSAMPERGENVLSSAIRHRDVIRQFGRFPSRNAALGRHDTSAELAYRSKGGYMG